MNAMKNIFLLLISTLMVISSYSQNTVSGVVKDMDDQFIFFATAALYNAKDSTLVAAESTNERGLYLLKDIADGSYYLTISMLGYGSQTLTGISLPYPNTTNHDFTLSADAQLLSTVEIKAKVPLMEQRADKLIVNVADNVTNTSGSLLDVMKKVPGMLVINDRLSMAGSGTPTILLNGKSTQYMDIQSLLRDMPGDNIQKVEIIHQPGAEYEAAGTGPILNIILKKNALVGTNGSATIGIGKGDLWDYTTGLNLSHYAGKLNVFGGIGFSQNAYVEEIQLVRRLSNINTSIDGVYEQVNRDEANPKTYRGNIRLDYDISNKHRIGFESKYFNNTNERIANNVTDVNLVSDVAQDYRLNTTNDIDRGWTYISANPYYIFEIDTSGQKLELDASYGSYQINAMNTLSTTNNIDNLMDIQRYTQPGDTKIFATSLDYTKPLSEIVTLKNGFKYSHADLDNNLISEDFIDQNWVNNTNQSNHYLFDEKIYAAYSKLQFKSGDWSGTAGLRYENSQSEGQSLTIDSTLSRNISKLFPSFSLSNKFMGPLTATVSYSYRIDRPRYSTLNPFVYYLDPFTFEQGNQNLRPELTHSGKFTISFEGQPFFNIEYKKSTDAIVEVTRQEPNSEEASKTDINFDERTQFSTSLFFPLDFIPGISGYGGVIASNTKFNSFYNEGIFERSQWSYTTFLQAEFKLPGDINAEIGGWYNSGQQEGIFNTEYLYGTSFGLSKKILDGKGKISFGIEDFANRFWHANVDYQQDMDLIVKWQAPVVNMRFSYKFGNQHLKSKTKTKSSASEELRRATQDN